MPSSRTHPRGNSIVQEEEQGPDNQWHSAHETISGRGRQNSSFSKWKYIYKQLEQCSRFTRRKKPRRDAIGVSTERKYLGNRFDYLQHDGDEWISVLHEQLEDFAVFYCCQRMVKFVFCFLQDTVMLRFVDFNMRLFWNHIVKRIDLGSSIAENQSAGVDGVC